MIEEKKESKQNKAQKNDKIAVILIRGVIGITKGIKDTLFMLKLRKKHTCVVIENNDTNKGMIKKIKDYVAYGEISDETLKEMITKRGKRNAKKQGMTKPFFELAPPIKGFERKGIKKSYQAGGALGYRGDKINDLIKRML